MCAIELNKAEMKEENERKDGVRGNEGDVCISRRRQVKKANEHFPPPPIDYDGMETHIFSFLPPYTLISHVIIAWSGAEEVFFLTHCHRGGRSLSHPSPSGVRVGLRRTAPSLISAHG